MLCGVMQALAETTMLFLARQQASPETWRHFVDQYRRWRIPAEPKPETIV